MKAKKFSLFPQNRGKYQKTKNSIMQIKQNFMLYGEGKQIFHPKFSKKSGKKPFPAVDKRGKKPYDKTKRKR